MAQYNKFNAFVEALAEKKHDLENDQLTVFLTNNAPAASNSVIADITEIDYSNCSSRDISTASSTQSGGTYQLTLNDLTLTASGGSVGAFRYVGVYNSSATNGELIAWFDYGSAITLADGESIDINFDDANGLLQLA